MMNSGPEFLAWLAIWAKIAAYALFASIGGFMGHIMRTIHAEKPLSWGRACVEGIAAGFVGLLMYFACEAMGFSEQWIGVIVGVSGWLGANASIRILESVVFQKLGLEKKLPETDDVQDTR